MFISNLLVSISTILDVVLGLYIFVIFVDVILSWINPPVNSDIAERLSCLTAPVYNFIRRRIRTTIRGFDFTPALVLLALIFLRSFLVGFLEDLAGTLK